MLLILNFSYSALNAWTCAGISCSENPNSANRCGICFSIVAMTFAIVCGLRADISCCCFSAVVAEIGSAPVVIVCSGGACSVVIPVRCERSAKLPYSGV